MVAKKKATALQPAQTTAATCTEDKPDWMNDGQRGQEGVGVDDLTIPRICLIQDLSPQRKKNDPAYIIGAEEGMIFNSVTNQLYGENVMFVPVFFRKEYVIWKDRNSGGGFKGAFPNEFAALNAMAELEDGDSCDVSEMAQQFGLIINGSKCEEAVISMARSQLKTSRQLNSIIKLSGGDRFSRMYKMSAIQDSGAKGDFFNWGVQVQGYVSKLVYEEAESMYNAVVGGNRDVNRDPE